MSGRSKQSGFTIIEVTLFLAISGLLFMIGFFGISNRTQSVQLTDSMHSLDSKIRDVFTDVFAGVNPRDANNLCDNLTTKQPGEADDCVFLGYMMEFNYPGNPAAPASEVIIHTMIGDQLTEEEVEDENDLRRQFFDANVRSVAQETYTIEWGSEFVGGSLVDLQTTGDPTIANNVIGFMRSPRGAGVLPVAYRDADDLEEGLEFHQIIMVAPADMRDALLCFNGSDNRRASIEIDATGGNITQLNIDDPRCDEF